MSTLHETLESYLALRRGLGSELSQPGAYLHRFVEFLGGEGVSVVTTELALRWATAPANATSATWARRLDDVRRFAVWLSATDPRTEVPPRGLLPDRYRRRPPYVYSRLSRARDKRHTYASLLIAQGESLAYIRDQLGHASIQLTVDTYGHLVPGANRQAVDRLDDATGRNPGATTKERRGYGVNRNPSSPLVAGAGFEPATFGL